MESDKSTKDPSLPLIDTSVFKEYLVQKFKGIIENVSASPQNTPLSYSSLKDTIKKSIAARSKPRTEFWLSLSKKRGHPFSGSRIVPS